MLLLGKFVVNPLGHRLIHMAAWMLDQEAILNDCYCKEKTNARQV